MNIDKEVAAMERMTVDQLRGKYAEVFGESTGSRHKAYLIKRIAWRMQANAEGGLSERALRRAMELANDAEVRVTAPRDRRPTSDATPPTTITMSPVRDPRLPPPGNWIERDYKGQTIRVLVVADGFEYEGKRYRSLSAVAKLVTGSHMNGFLFFQLWRGK